MDQNHHDYEKDKLGSEALAEINPSVNYNEEELDKEKNQEGGWDVVTHDQICDGCLSRVLLK